MRRFNATCGFLLFFLLAAAMAFGRRRGGVAPELFGAAIIALMAVWLVMTTAVFLIQVMLGLARGIARDAGRGTLTGGRREPQRLSGRLGGYALPPLPPPPVTHDLIERLCRETGWVLASREADFYRVRPGDHTAIQYVEIRYSERFANILFQSWFPVRFSLKEPPAGLSARLLLRNTNLHWSSWTMSIGHSSEGCFYVGASVPPGSLDARLFDAVCREMVGEIHAFHQELHDKFAYGLGQAAADTPYLPPQARSGVPQRRGDDVPGIRYTG